jgi:vancomycin resistance protein YoaR
MNLAQDRAISKASQAGAAILVVFTLALLLLSVAFVALSLDNGLSHAGIYVAQTSVGDLERANVLRRLLSIEESRVLAPITLEWNEKEWTLYPSRVDTRLDVLAAYDQVMRVGRDGDLADRLKQIVQANTNLIEVHPALTCSETELMRYVSWLAGRIDREPRSAQLRFSPDGRVEVVDEVIGYRLDKAATVDAIRKVILTMASDRRVELPVVEIKPGLTRDDIAAWPQLDVIGRFTTLFDPANLERTYNLKLSSHSLNGHVLLPGDEFSFNQVVGPRVPLRGYKEADVIVNGRMVPDFGGGVCQVSSTLYNAVLLADLQVTVRYNHSLILNYIEPGTDATVVYDYRDFRFRNNTRAPVVVGAWVSGNRVEVALFGNAQPGKSVEIVTEVLEKTDPPVQYKDDPTLPKGQKVVERWGAPDLLVETRKIVSQNGEVVRNQIISRDRYYNAPRIIRVGTGEGAQAVAEAPSP